MVYLVYNCIGTNFWNNLVAQYILLQSNEKRVYLCMCSSSTPLCVIPMSIRLWEGSVIFGHALIRPCIWFLVAGTISSRTPVIVSWRSVVGRNAVKSTSSCTYEEGRTTKTFGRIYIKCVACRASISHEALYDYILNMNGNACDMHKWSLKHTFPHTTQAISSEYFIIKHMDIR